MSAASAAAARIARWAPPLLAAREFRRFWTAQTISLVGDQITLIALPLTAVLVLDADAAEMGYLTAAALAPNLFFALHAGAWVDRRGSRRQVMIAADLGRAVLLASIPVAYALDVLTLAQLYAVAFVAGTLAVFFYVSYDALFVSLVPRERYVEGNSLVHGSRAFSGVAGPSLGGILVQLLTAPFALVVDAVSFLASALLLRGVAATEPPTEQPGSGHVLEGIRFIWRAAALRASLLATATLNLFNYAFHALFILYATRTLDISAGTLGLVLGAGAIGGLIGAALTGRISQRIGLGPAFIAGCFLFPAPLILVPLAGGPQPLVLAMLFLAEFGAGFGVMILDISAGSLFQFLVPDRLRSRFSGAYMVVNNGVRPLGALIGGALGTAVGIRPTLWLAAVGALLGVLWLVFSPMPGIREAPPQATG